jgi:hypothetical protein
MTNGLVSIIRDGKVILKVVVGCNGMNASDFADQLVASGNFKVFPAVEIARAADFGCDDCLVAMDDMGEIECGDLFPEDLGPLYFSKFQDPRFNPRWTCGLCEYTEVRDVSEAPA